MACKLSMSLYKDADYHINFKYSEIIVFVACTLERLPSLRFVEKGFIFLSDILHKTIDYDKTVAQVNVTRTNTV